MASTKAATPIIHGRIADRRHDVSPPEKSNMGVASTRQEAESETENKLFRWIRRLFRHYLVLRSQPLGDSSLEFDVCFSWGCLSFCFQLKSRESERRDT